MNQCMDKKNLPSLANRFALTKEGVMAFIEEDATSFIEKLGGKKPKVRCEIVPRYGYDVILGDIIRIPVPDVKLSSGNSILEHLAQTGKVVIYACSQGEYLMVQIAELFLDTTGLREAKGRYEMALVLMAQEPNANLKFLSPENKKPL